MGTGAGNREPEFSFFQVVLERYKKNLAPEKVSEKAWYQKSIGIKNIWYGKKYRYRLIFCVQSHTDFNSEIMIARTEAGSSASDRSLMIEERKWASFCTHSASY